MLGSFTLVSCGLTDESCASGDGLDWYESFCCCRYLILTELGAQDTQLYISDPKALYTILIKEQYVFEESAMFIKYGTALF